MAQLPSAFNAQKAEKMNDFSPIPEGDYIAQIVKSELKKCKPTAKDPSGQYIQLQFKIIQGESAGRLLFTNLNIINKNPQAVEIAYKELATIAEACGKPVVQDTQELHGIPMTIKVGLTAATPQRPPQNEIKFYEALGGQQAAPNFATQQVQQTAPQEVAQTYEAAQAVTAEPEAPAKRPWD